MYEEVLVFPGQFNLPELHKQVPKSARVHFDIAYDIQDLSELNIFRGKIGALILSTSSEWFLAERSSPIEALLAKARILSPEVLLLKENRGGSRLFELKENVIHEIPAVLGETINSVGVGDVYSAVLIGRFSDNWAEAGWRAAQAATCYSQTTFVDDFKRNTQRELKLSLSTVQGLGGTFLPWHERPKYPVYLASPDFSYTDNLEIDSAVASLSYHNFIVRRPVEENGEIPKDSNLFLLQDTYRKDVALLRKCAVVFAIPLGRDPGTLVEIGMALEMRKPVITFDPRRENSNTMVIAGSHTYSCKLDNALNGLFESLSNLRVSR